MNKEIKLYADNKDLQSLKYIFVDALDVDPTFVRYQKEYDYCKSIPGLLENHRELTAFVYNENLWDDEYWSKLKMDLIENFSDKRFMHMREVAKVYLKDKIDRILVERKEASKVSSNIVMNKYSINKTNQSFIVETKKEGSKAIQERMRLEEERRKLEEENRIFIESQKIKKEQVKQIQNPIVQSNSSSTSKKAIGIVVVAVLVLILLLIVISK